MADSPFLSDTDDSAVDQILAEAMDHCVLEQIAKINCSSFSDSTLPSNLESRFHRLKTFPSSSSNPNPDPKIEKPSFGNASDSSNSPFGHPNLGQIRANSGDGKVKGGKLQSGSFSISPNFRENEKKFEEKPYFGNANLGQFRAKLGDGRVKRGKLQSGSFSNCPNFRVESEKNFEGKPYFGDSCASDSSNSPSGDASLGQFRAQLDGGKVKGGKLHSGSFSNSPKFREELGDGKKVKRGNLRARSFSFRSNSSNSSTETETVKSGCFWCSPKKNLRKKSGNRANGGVGELGFINWGDDHDDDVDEILSDLKSFSTKEQKKVMKKAIKEEEKIIKEAEKIVKWAKQSSSRMDFSLSDDELSDH